MLRIVIGLLSSLVLMGCSSLESKDGGPGGASTGVSDDVEFVGDNDLHWRAPHARGTAERGPATDIWSRLRAEFALTHVEHERIQRELARYRAHPEGLTGTSGHAVPFLYLITDRVARRSMPGEVALVPFVESRYRPQARSPKSATGLWQIMPSTARRFGLDRNWWYDGRKDVVASTDAALEYLSYLNGLFDGDWLLTLAAYNAGEGRVRKAVSHNAKRGLPTSFWHLPLPKETRRYVPKILAVSRIVYDPDAYGIALADIPNQPVLGVARFRGQIDLTLAAELADVPLKSLFELNAGFRRWASPPDGPHELLLPTEAVAGFEGRLAAAGPQTPVVWHSHTVARGETLSHIARHYGVPVAAIRDTNRLTGDRIRAGSTLAVPRVGDPETLARMMAALPDRDASGNQRVTYTVRRGDSLWTIARRFGVSHRSLADWNDLSLTTVIRPGRKLIVWT
jgi:membrane-bound lytic murein transglycosylase D